MLKKGFAHLYILLAVIIVVALILVGRNLNKLDFFGKNSSHADVGFSSNVITDGSLVLSVPSVGKPGYLTAISPSPFNLPVIRIGGDAGKTFTAFDASQGKNITGTWGSDVRHHYNDDQAWSQDGSLFAIQNENGGSPSLVFLDGNNYTPKYVCGNYSEYDDRWNPNPNHKNERINVRSSSPTLEWFDVTTCKQTRSWNLPFVSIGDLSQNPSLDGRFIALWNASTMKVYVVDMDPPSTLPSYCNGSATGCIGPVFDLGTNCGRSACTVDHLAVSPSGKYLVAGYQGDHPRVFDINPTTLALTPHQEPSTAPECPDPSNNNQLPSPSDGWVWDLGHEGMMQNPYDNNEEVVIGQRRSWCSSLNGVTLGHVVMVRLKDGLVTSLTDPNNEAYSYHISTVDTGRPGWAYVSYWPGSGNIFNDEIIAVKTDGSKSVQRFVHTHTDTTNCYRCESHPVPSRDGTRIVFASSWSLNCGSVCGTQTNPQDYILDARATSTSSPSPTPSPTPTVGPNSSPTPTFLPTPTPSANPDTTAPTVSITAPSDGAIFARNSTININVSANDPDFGGVSKVELYVNGSLKSTDSSSPYTFSYRLGGKRNTVYTLTAKAYDAAGNVSSSNPVNITAQ